MVAEKDLEQWENRNAGPVFIKRLDHRGDLTRDEQINSGKSARITTEERKLNQEMAFSPELDMFTNGTLHPVKFAEGSDAAMEFASNPNHLSEPDMKAIVKGRANALKEKLATIQNATTLNRLLELARIEDAPISKVEAIQERIDELTPTNSPVFSKTP